MRQEYPIITTFGATATEAFPLLLVIGREPNNDSIAVNYVGEYDFRWAPRCGFWNTAYSITARLSGKTPRALKQECIEKSGSPIIFADALPEGILNRVGDKRTIRASMSEEAMDAHLANLFSHQAIMARTRLILISGLDGPVFDHARCSIQDHCRVIEISSVEVPFFYGTNTPKIWDALGEIERGIIREVMLEFYGSAARSSYS